MKSKLFLVALLGLALLLGTAGCNTTDQGFSNEQMVSNLKQIRIGLTTDQVVALLGRPASINTSIAATGRLETWTYYDSQFRTFGQQMAVGALEGSGSVVRNGALTLTFTGGKVSLIQTAS